MLKDKFKKIAQDKKIVDVNDYWLIPDNPMTKIGVFYLRKGIMTMICIYGYNFITSKL